MPLQGQVAIVTGASQGIGRSAAELLASRGASILVSYFGADAPAQDTVGAIESMGVKALGFNADLGVPANVEEMFRFCTERLGQPDVLVSNAGVGVPPKPLVEVTEQDYEFLFRVNVKAHLFCLKEAKKHLADGGRIVLTSSSSVKNPVDGLAVYIAAKAGLLALAQATVREFAERGITINTVLPGVTDTPMINDLTTEYKDMVAQASPFNRLGRPQDVAEVIGFLCEKRSQWLSGQYLVANGGSPY